jgi:hypothetical protein
MGNRCRDLELICNAESNAKRGQTFLGLVSGLKSFLRLFRMTVVEVPKNTTDHRLNVSGVSAM